MVSLRLSSDIIAARSESIYSCSSLMNRDQVQMLDHRMKLVESFLFEKSSFAKRMHNA